MDDVPIGINSSSWKCYRNSRVEGRKLGCSPKVVLDAPRNWSLPKPRPAKNGKELPSLWWRWRDIKQTKIGRASIDINKIPEMLTVRVNQSIPGLMERRNRKTGQEVRQSKKLAKKWLHTTLSQSVNETDSKKKQG